MSITINEDTTFLITDEIGDIQPGSELGLYYQDSRFLSQYELRLDGHRPRLLAARALEHYHAVHLLSNPVSEKLAAESLSLIRHRLVGQGLHEDLELQSHLDEPVVLVLELRIAADYWHIFEVRGHIRPREAHAPDGAAVCHPLAHGWGLRLAYRADQEYPCTELHFSQPPTFPQPGRAQFRVTLGPRGNWRLCVDVLPRVGVTDLRRPTYSCQRPPSPEVLAAQHQRRGEAIAAAPRLETDYYPLQEAYDRALRDLWALQFKGEALGELVLAAGIPWFMALFGRDSLIAAYQALPYYPEVAPGVLRALARLQGTKVDPLTEEEPGKIPHEYRPESLAAPRALIPAFPYYGTIDATPLFLIVLAETYRYTGDQALLSELWAPAERALQWMDQYGDRDGDGFLEYCRSGEVGLVNQGWKDSWDSVRFRDGTIARAPIALCEVQGYAYAARLAMADLYEARGQPARARELRQQATALAARFDRDFWLPDRSYYALALDGAKRQVDSLTSNPGQALWAGIVPPARAPLVANHLLGPELFSGWGVRTMGAAEGGYSPIGYHTGTVWPHDNSLIAAGLARYELYSHAGQIIEAQLAAAAQFPAYRLPELFSGHSRAEYGFVVEYPVACSPQAWSAGAILLYVTTLLGLAVDTPRRRIVLRPFLPPKIGRLRLSGVRVGGGELDVELTRSYGRVQSRLHHAPPGFQIEGAIRRGGLFW
ncbi:MAG TPA: glycogen debranching N-terminal domain-containing protein [Chloroflexota bacterium]|nr:glycogen debranching N-terminal domain-containing protein [Chloroflexota bacterium]HZU05583.1 glycogen debranching N-terminal domain-containing protein [Chloroflexota bacterium]